jgi:hypothetical protein
MNCQKNTIKLKATSYLDFECPLGLEKLERDAILKEVGRDLERKLSTLSITTSAWFRGFHQEKASGPETSWVSLKFSGFIT